MDEWENKCGRYILEYYLALKRKQIMTHAT